MGWRKHVRLTIYLYREFDEVVVQVEKDDKFYDEAEFTVDERDEFYAYMHKILKEVIE